jgi:VanZ family protein
MSDGGSARGARPALRLKAIWWGIGWTMVLCIAFACLSPERYVPNLHLWDKLEHALAFFGLTFWFCGLVRLRFYPLVALVMLLFGAGIEVAQGTMGLGRDADLFDWVADAVGVGAALVLVYTAVCLSAGSWISRIEQLLGMARERA